MSLRRCDGNSYLQGKTPGATTQRRRGRTLGTGRLGRYTSAVVMLAAALVAAAGCGGGSSGDTSDAVTRTSTNLRDIQSGDLTFTFRAEDEGSRTGIDLEGPFALAERRGALPVADLTYTQTANGQRATVTLISTGKKAYIEASGRAFVLPDAQTRSFRAVSAPGKHSSGLASLDVASWLVDPKLSDGGRLGGAETDHITATLDVVAAANDLLALTAATRGGEATRIQGDDAERLEDAVDSSNVEVWTGKEDRLLRRLVLDLRLGSDVPEDLRSKLGSLGAPHVSLEFRIADPNGPVRVEAPAHAKPLPQPGLF